MRIRKYQEYSSRWIITADDEQFVFAGFGHPALPENWPNWQVFDRSASPVVFTQLAEVIEALATMRPSAGAYQVHEVYRHRQPKWAADEASRNTLLHDRVYAWLKGSERRGVAPYRMLNGRHLAAIRGRR